MCLINNLGITQAALNPLKIIDKSIQYHDPDLKLLNHKTYWDFVGTRPDKEDVKDEILIDLGNERYELQSFREGNIIKSVINKDKIGFEFNGSSDISEANREKFRMNPERALLLKNYYQYLWLMPLKLKDPGTIVNDLVQKIDFFGKNTLRIQIDYEPEVGGDRWYFYFDPSNYALVGYQFYHDEAQNDGEYIILEGEYQFENVRIPKKRTWYTNKEDKLLGTDILNKFKIHH